MRIAMRHCWPIILSANLRSHWGVCPWTPDGVYGDWVHESLRGKPKYRGVQHDECPKDWPWWRLVSWYLGKLDASPPSSGRRLWIYTRWGAVYFEGWIDRRGGPR